MVVEETSDAEIPFALSVVVNVGFEERTTDPVPVAVVKSV